MFVVINRRMPVYIGSDRDKAVAIFESQPGSMLGKAETLDELNVLLKSEPDACCGGHGNCHEVAQEGPTPEEVEAFINDFIKSAQAYGSKIVDTIWANLERVGVSKEKVSEALDKVQEEAIQVAAEAEISGKQGVAALGDLLIRFGNSLIERSK